jgi:hypothetical protein
LRCPRRQAKPRAVLRRLARAKHRGLLRVLAGRSLAAILLVLADMRSIAASCFGLCPGSGDAPGTRRLGSLRYIGAPAGCFDGLDSLRPSKRRSRSQAWSKRFSCGMQGWNDWSGAAGKLASPSRARGEQCGYLARGTSASVRSVRTGVRAGGSATCHLATFPDEERSDEVSMPDTALKIIRQPERLECGNDIQIHETVQRARGVAKGPPSVTSVNPRWRPGARP